MHGDRREHIGVVIAEQSRQRCARGHARYIHALRINGCELERFTNHFKNDRAFAEARRRIRLKPIPAAAHVRKTRLIRVEHREPFAICDCVHACALCKFICRFFAAVNHHHQWQSLLIPRMRRHIESKISLGWQE